MELRRNFKKYMDMPIRIKAIVSVIKIFPQGHTRPR